METLSDRLSRRVAGEADPHSAIAETVERYTPFLREVVARLCPVHLGVERSEIEQEARIRLWKALEREREILDFQSYLYRIVSRVAIDAVREAKARAEQQFHPGQEETIERRIIMPGRHVESVESVAHRRQVLRRITGFVNELPAARRQAVKLYLQGFTLVEIGQLSGWTEPKARNLTYRGLDELRAKLAAAGLKYDDLE